MRTKLLGGITLLPLITMLICINSATCAITLYEMIGKPCSVLGMHMNLSSAELDFSLKQTSEQASGTK